MMHLKSKRYKRCKQPCGSRANFLRHPEAFKEFYEGIDRILPRLTYCLAPGKVQEKTGARMSSVNAVLNGLCNHVSGGPRRGFYTLKPEFGGTVDPRTGQGR